MRLNGLPVISAKGQRCTLKLATTQMPHFPSIVAISAIGIASGSLKRKRRRLVPLKQRTRQADNEF